MAGLGAFLYLAASHNYNRRHIEQLQFPRRKNKTAKKNSAKVRG